MRILALSGLFATVLFVGLPTPAQAADSYFLAEWDALRSYWPILPCAVVGRDLPPPTWGVIAYSDLDEQGCAIFRFNRKYSPAARDVSHEAGHAFSTMVRRRHLDPHLFLWAHRGFPGTPAQTYMLLEPLTNQWQRWAMSPEESFAETFALGARGYAERTENYSHSIDRDSAAALMSMLMWGAYGQVP